MPVHVRPDLPEASPIVMIETETHVVIAMEIAKATLARHRRFLELLLCGGHQCGPAAAVISWTWRG